MDKEALSKQVASMLGVSNSEKDLAFSILVDKITDILAPDEALKVPDLGYFQIKRKPIKLVEKIIADDLGAEFNDTLLFSPITGIDQQESNLMFLTFDIPSVKIDNSKLDETVFDIGFGKPILPLSDEILISDSDTSFLLLKKSIEERVLELLADCQKLENFDLWEDYLNTLNENMQLTNTQDSLLYSLTEDESASSGDDSSNLEDFNKSEYIFEQNEIKSDLPESDSSADEIYDDDEEMDRLLEILEGEIDVQKTEGESSVAGTLTDDSTSEEPLEVAHDFRLSDDSILDAEKELENLTPDTEVVESNDKLSDELNDLSEAISHDYEDDFTSEGPLEVGHDFTLSEDSIPKVENKAEDLLTQSNPIETKDQVTEKSNELISPDFEDDSTSEEPLEVEHELTLSNKNLLALEKETEELATHTNATEINDKIHDEVNELSESVSIILEDDSVEREVIIGNTPDFSADLKKDSNSEMSKLNADSQEDSVEEIIKDFEKHSIDNEDSELSLPVELDLDTAEINLQEIVQKEEIHLDSLKPTENEEIIEKYEKEIENEIDKEEFLNEFDSSMKNTVTTDFIKEINSDFDMDFETENFLNDIKSGSEKNLDPEDLVIDFRPSSDELDNEDLLIDLTSDSKQTSEKEILTDSPAITSDETGDSLKNDKPESTEYRGSLTFIEDSEPDLAEDDDFVFSTEEDNLITNSEDQMSDDKNPDMEWDFEELRDDEEEKMEISEHIEDDTDIFKRLEETLSEEENLSEKPLDSTFENADSELTSTDEHFQYETQTETAESSGITLDLSNEEEISSKENTSAKIPLSESIKPGKGKMIWAVTAASIVVIFIIVYFFTGGSGDSGNTTPLPIVADSSQHSDSGEVVTITKPEEENTPASVTSPLEQASTGDVKPAVSGESLLKEFPNEKTVANLIFFNGTDYYVQVSSHSTLEKAEREVKRLKALGHDAFIMKAWIDKFNSYWYRVKVGYFKSVDAAKAFQRNNNL